MKNRSPIRILVVEDDDRHAKLISRCLDRETLASSVERVENGAQALEYLHKEGRYQTADRPDLVLLDLEMPAMNGIDVLRHVKADPELASIPVVMLSTSDDPMDRQLAYALHVNSYLVKPPDLLLMERLVRDLLSYWSVWNRPPS